MPSRAVLLAVVAAAVVLALVALTDPFSSSPRRSDRGVRPPARGEFTLASRAHPVRVPGSFLGFSTEYWTIPIWRRRLPVVRRALSLLKVRKDDGVVLRIGGDSSDQALFERKGRESPEWVFELSGGWLHKARAVIRGAKVRLILDLNLLTATPAIASRWAGLAHRALPRGSIAGFEIGNEPDIYRRIYRLRLITEKALADELLPGDKVAANYARYYRLYARRVMRVAPRVPLIAPALADPVKHFRWIPTLLRGPHPGLGGVSVHQYPYSACEPRGTRGFPTVARVLGERATAGLARNVRPALREARRAGLSLRLTELNSVTCGGRAGVSDSFATALWAPDALFELMREGVVGADVHIRTHRVNEAFTLTRRGLVAHPLLYGLAAFTRALAPDAELVPLRGTRPPGVKLWAVRSPGRLQIVAIAKGPRAARAVLRVPGRGRARVERLRAPSVRSRSGVTLAGQRLGIDGRWHGARSRETLERRGDAYRLTLPGHSAAIVSLRLPRGR